MIYFIRAVGIGMIKIGYTRDVDARLAGLRPISPVPLEVVAVRDGTLKDERDLHAALADSHSHNEWFFATQSVLEAAQGRKAIATAPEQAHNGSIILAHICAGCGVSFNRMYREGQSVPKRPFHNLDCRYTNGKTSCGNRVVDASRLGGNNAAQ